jgi:hypothetical protein
LGLSFDLVAVFAHSLDVLGAEDRRAWDAERRQAFDVVHFFDALGAAVILEPAHFVASAHRRFDAVRYA